MKPIDMINRTFSKLTVIDYAKDVVTPRGRHQKQYQCHCECGNIAIVRGDCLRNGSQRSCGCLKKNTTPYKERVYKYQRDRRAYTLRPDVKKKSRNKELQRLYNINIEQYEELLKQQNNQCLLCGDRFTEENKPYVDHNHITGKVRGLIHNKCNRGLGHFDDDVELLQMAINYLKRYEDA